MGTESVLASEIKTFFHKAHYVTYRSKAQCLLKITSETLVHLLADDEINPSHKTLLVIHQSKQSFIMKSFQRKIKLRQMFAISLEMFIH